MLTSSGYRQVPEFLQPPEKENPLKHVEDTIEQNDNNFDGIINNTPSVDELEKKSKIRGTDFFDRPCRRNQSRENTQQG